MGCAGSTWTDYGSCAEHVFAPGHAWCTDEECQAYEGCTNMTPTAPANCLCTDIPPPDPHETWWEQWRRGKHTEVL